MSRKLLILILISTNCFAVYSVAAYENAYDLMERQSPKFYESRHFQPEFYTKSRFFTHNLMPRLRTPDMNRFISVFGNGYDNIGNGIPGHFHPFRQEDMRSWRYESRPQRQRIFQGYFSLGRPYLEYIHHYPIIHSNTPSGLYGDESSLRGKTNTEKVDRFFKDDEDQTQKKLDEFYRRNQERAQIDSLKKEKAGEKLYVDQAGENKSSLRSNKVVKKGRTTTGFAVHHHKDETGNSTTFFDETSDFGGQSDLKDIADGFDTRKTLEQITQKGDEKYFTEAEEKSGNYGSGLLKKNQRLEKNLSSLDKQEQSRREYYGNGNDDLNQRKTYQYLNHDAFDYSKPHIDNY